MPILAPSFSPIQGQGDADRADDQGGHGQVDVVGAQGEADCQVVDAQRDPGDQQPADPALRRRRCFLT